MNKQEIIEKIKEMTVETFFSGTLFVKQKEVIKLIEQLDEPQAIKLKDVIVRIKQLDIGTRKVWLDEFLNKLGSDYGLLKYKAGYEQGKLEGAMEREKVIVPQFVADWIEIAKKELSLREAMLKDYVPHDVENWLMEMDQDGAFINQDLFDRAWLDGYEVEKEKRYLVKMKNIHSYSSTLKHDNITGEYFFGNEVQMCASSSAHTRKELEEAGFGWVFDCEGIEVEEVE